MKNKKVKYDGRGWHKRAVLHMIGQSVDTFGEKPTTADIAAWMNVSKPTARKYLKEMEDNGEVVCEVSQYRSNAVIHRWALDPFAEEHYHENMLKHAYELYAQRIMGLILQ